MVNTSRKATIYRRVMKEHVCPCGLKSVWLLRHSGFEVDDNWLTTREETDAFREKHSVKTTPKTFIDGKSIGSDDPLRTHFNLPLPDNDKMSYLPPIINHDNLKNILFEPDLYHQSKENTYAL